MSSIDLFTPIARSWFTGTFAEPTRAQELGWDAVASGEHALLLAPTGSGKTLAAFLWALDRLADRYKDGSPKKRAGVTVLYISPLKALTYDIERNLVAPLRGLTLAAQSAGLQPPEIIVASRTGDTPQKERERIRRNPPDVLVTTPESLYLLLTSRSHEILKTVETVIVDEIHTMAATKRGAHLALSLERLEALTERPPQRIGLSATQRPLDEVARYLAGSRLVRIADAGTQRSLDIEVVVPVEDMTKPLQFDGPTTYGALDGSPEARSSIWPSVYPALLEQIKAHRSTLLFVNNRRLAERLAARLNELAGEEIALAHHGSIAHEQRTQIENRLKSGTLPALVCTSSMELGIDMGAVDLVIQVESPKSVARGLQRVGRAGHNVGGTSRGRIFPKYRGDLVECAVLAERMREGLIESTKVIRNPLDVLAQQIVAMTAMDEMRVDDILAVVRRTYAFADLSRDALENVLGMLAGQYPSDEFADLRPRVIWDRSSDTVVARKDAKTVAVVNGGTIPDRGLYGVYLGEDGPRVGELDEEMVYESRPGETFILGASTWRIEQITQNRVIVSGAPGEPGKMPFWKGEGIGRPLELGRAVGAFLRELSSLEDTDAATRLRDRHHLDELATNNLLAYLEEEREETGTLPTDRNIVVEQFRDELGDWRVAILTPFGAQVHAPWALAVEAALAQKAGFEVQAISSDDGIILRFADSDQPPPVDSFFPDPEEIEQLLIGQLSQSSLFGTRFRENASRALLLPRHRPHERVPLWVQRQKAANLLAVASRYGSFPMIMETYRECLADVFDLPGLREVLGEIRSRRVKVTQVETKHASPFARSLLFDYVAAYMYEGDIPLAERRAHALSLDRALLRELIGDDELRELLDPGVIAEVELELQYLARRRKPKNADQLHDLLRALGDLTLEELAARVEAPADLDSLLATLVATTRATRVRIAGEERWVAVEDVGNYRDALGIAPPPGVPESFVQRPEAPLEAIVARYARTHGPFLASEAAGRWNAPEIVVREALVSLERRDVVVSGAFRPGGVEREWCDNEVLRMLRRRSLALLRKEVEPVDPVAYARFLPRWQGVGERGRGLDRLREALVQLEGYPVPVSVLERDVLPARVSGYEPRMLDELGANGEVAWLGRGPLGNRDGRIALYRRERLRELLPSVDEPPDGPLHQAILTALRENGASFFADVVAEAEAKPREVLEALWDLVWAGLVSNDTFAPLRGLGLPARPTFRPGRGTLVPPDAVGRWSLTPVAKELAAAKAEGGAGAKVATNRAHHLAGLLLERYGIVTRETAQAEGLAGGFSAVYPVLQAMEQAGRIRRGYFIDGLGGAQFAVPAVVDALRAERDPEERGVARVLAATDPANPYGAALPWPREEEGGRHPFQRAAGAYVITVDGELVLYVERGGRSVVTLPRFADEQTAQTALWELTERLGKRKHGLMFERIDGEPAAQSPHAKAFEATGFVVGYRGLIYREQVDPREVVRARR